MSTKKMTPQQQIQFLQDQCEEIQKYKWCLGIELRHDPLEDRTINEICYEWLDKFAGTYRKEWEEKHNIV